ncbi:glycosyltransferase family 4 protein [Aminobacter carboxidus]
MNKADNRAEHAGAVDMARTEVIAPNLKQRLSGVTSTIVQLVPVQARALGIAVVGPGLPDHLPRMRWWQLPSLLRRPASGRPRIWHARRNTEMVAGLVLRHIFWAQIRLVFTSAAQRDHRPFTKWLLRQMDGVIATSRLSGRFLEVPHKVVMHGVDLDKFHPPRTAEDEFAATGLPGKYAIGCFGRVRHSKGTDLFVDAMIALLPEYPEWTAVITGRVTAEHKGFADELRQRIAAAGLSERILLLGEVPDVAVWYRRVTLYVAPSRNEGFGLTPLEAMASRTAVVASDAGSYSEIVTRGVTGDFVASGDGDALREAIRPYLADPELAETHGAAGLDDVSKRFRLENEAAGLRAVYELVWAKG